MAVVNGAWALGVLAIPHLWCMWQASPWLRRDTRQTDRLAQGVAEWVTNSVTAEAFHTGDPQFDGEWLFGTYMMAGMGFGQAALAHPEHRAEYSRLMAQCIERLMSPEVREFDRRMWGGDPIEALDSDAHHAAFLGYLNMVLGLHRVVDTASPYAALNDRITDALVRRLDRAPSGILKSYPGEAYPLDNCAVIASIGLHGRAAGMDHRALLECWSANCRNRWVDPATGLLIQAVNPGGGTGSGL